MSWSGALKRFESGFVYQVPLLLSFLMVYDFVETNSMMIGFIKSNFYSQKLHWISLYTVAAADGGVCYEKE